MIKKIFFLFCILLPSVAYANFFDLQYYHSYGPIPVRTQNPLYLQFIAMPLDTASSLPRGRFAFDLQTTFSNIFEYHPNAVGFGVNVDMELVRTALGVHYGLTKRQEVSFEVPVVSDFGGFLDGFVQGYHNAFGFPNGGRDKVANGTFNYAITLNGVDFYRANQVSLGLSNLQLAYKARVIDETHLMPAIALKASVKLPTGSKGQGSGNPDFGFSLFAEKSYKRLHSYSQVGFLVLGGNDDLDPILRKGAFVFGQAFEFNIRDSFSLITQVSGNTSFFSGTGINELDGIVCDLTIGFAGSRRLDGFFPRIFYRFGFTEDVLSVGPSVDFTTFFNVGFIY